MTDLKLQALDAEDLTVLSAHCQDALVIAADIAYRPQARRFALVCNRFDWASNAPRAWLAFWRAKSFQRRRAGLHFETVTRVTSQGIDLASKDAILSLLAITFESGSLPGGRITLNFADGAAIRLDVECIEAELKDLGAAWTSESRPDHGPDDAT
jgi:Protein of unknown function (DUF2948)